MSKITLHIKVYNETQKKHLNNYLNFTFKRLKVKTKNFNIISSNWIQLDLYGEDERIAEKYLANRIGLCPAHLEDIEKFSTIKGYITLVKKGNLYLDIGVFVPNIAYATISTHILQAQLIDGKNFPLEKLFKLFGFCKNMPLTIKVISINKEKNRIESILSERQISNYRAWEKSLLERLIILGPSTFEVRMALRRARLNRDVIKVESLGFFENALVCKLGTNAVGLISKLGEILKYGTFTVFNPKKVIEVFNNPSFSSD